LTLTSSDTSAAERCRTASSAGVVVVGVVVEMGALLVGVGGRCAAQQSAVYRLPEKKAIPPSVTSTSENHP
jgi:hypothetical protein